jgi:hypothetical protein
MDDLVRHADRRADCRGGASDMIGEERFQHRALSCPASMSRLSIHRPKWPNAPSERITPVGE